MTELRHRLNDAGTNGGDPFERDLFHLIAPQFPNYEVLWSEVVWDLTNRATHPQMPLAWHFQAGVPPPLVIACQSHYTIFRCLLYVALVKDVRWDGKSPLLRVLDAERMKSCYNFFGSALDLTGRIFDLLECMERGLASAESKPESTDAIKKRFDAWLTDESEDGYRAAFRRFDEQNIPVNFQAHNRQEAASRILPPALWHTYHTVATRIRTYRNLAHNPDTGRIIDANGKQWVPKREFLKACAAWPDMQVEFARAQEKFQSLDAMIDADLGETLSLLNQAWDILMPRLVAILSHPNYESWKAAFFQDKKRQELDAAYTTQIAHYLQWVQQQQSPALPPMSVGLCHPSGWSPLGSSTQPSFNPPKKNVPK